MYFYTFFSTPPLPFQIKYHHHYDKLKGRKKNDKSNQRLVLLPSRRHELKDHTKLFQLPINKKKSWPLPILTGPTAKKNICCFPSQSASVFLRMKKNDERGISATHHSLPNPSHSLVPGRLNKYVSLKLIIIFFYDFHIYM